MALRAAPVLVLSLGCEMAYVLDQRLKAQQVEDRKKGMVLRDILQALFSPDFLQALFKEQPVGAFAETQSLFWKIAHSSIMRLNPSSMEKLYVLMVMGFKHQAMRCVAPQELCDLVLTHLKTVKELVDDQGVLESIVATEKKFEGYRDSLSNGQWEMLRQAVLRFVQDQRTKISVLLDKGLQSKAGIMRLPEPGADGQGPGKRARLGGNMYAGADQPAPPAATGRGEVEGEPKAPTAVALGEAPSAAAAHTSSLPDRREADRPALDPEVVSATDNAVVSGELNALASLIAPEKETGDNFKLRLFDDDSGAGPSSSRPAPSGSGGGGGDTITLAAGASSHRAGLDSLVASLTVAPAARAPAAPEDDLLDLLDSA
jgi:hypothetical protein